MSILIKMLEALVVNINKTNKIKKYHMSPMTAKQNFLKDPQEDFISFMDTKFISN